MSQKASDKQFLLHPIENRRNGTQGSKNAMAPSLPTQHHAATSTGQLQLNRDTGTNTPNYAEQMVKAMESGRGTDEVVQMLLEAEASESYWKLMTERRRCAIEETNVENQQLHVLIDDLSKENDQLRVVVGHCDYLQDVLEKLTADNDSLFDDTHDDDSPID